ncbi:MAG: GntR family transcriptional regulator [Candidatus Ratteibacteria bacterium]
MEKLSTRKIFLYEKIKNYLLELIEKGMEGEQLPTERQLASLFSVSHITVRKALVELEKEFAVIRLQGKGTFIRKNYKSKNSEMLHMLVIQPPQEYVEVSFIHPIISGCLIHARKNNISIHVFPYTYQKSELLSKCRDFKIEAIVWIFPLPEYFEVIKELQNIGYPIVIINRIEKNQQFNYVSTDHEKGAEEITHFLINKGHEKIGFVGLIEEISCYRQRFKGFLKACGNIEENFPCEGVVKIESKSYAAWDFLSSKEGFNKKFEKMYDDYQPSAILVAGMKFLEAILPWLKQNPSLFPAKLEIATFDEIEQKYEEKQYIHEVLQPLVELGKIAAEELEKIVKKEVKSTQIVLSPYLRLKTELYK